MEKTDEGRKLSAEIRANLSVWFEQLSAQSPTKWTNQPTKKPFLFSIKCETAASSEVHKSYCTLSRGAMNKTFRGLPWTRPNGHRVPITKTCSISQLWLVRHQYTKSKAKNNINISRILLYFNTHPSQVNFLSNPPHFKDVLSEIKVFCQNHRHRCPVRMCNEEDAAEEIDER